MARTREYKEATQVTERYYSAHTGKIQTRHPTPSLQYRTTSSEIGKGQSFDPPRH